MKPSNKSQVNLSKLGKSTNELHMLYSMLPLQYELYEKRELKKTRQFYHPQQFIWNNPYRASDRLYKYYHKANDLYKTIKEPLIMEKERQDRQSQSLNRIVWLSRRREETRAKFQSQKQLRMQMQQKVGIKRVSSNQLLSSRLLVGTNNRIQTNRNLMSHQSQLTLKRSNSEFSKKPSASIKQLGGLYKKMKTNEEQTSNNQKSYLRSLQNFDLKSQATMLILKHSEKQMKRRIRQNFINEKENNLINQINQYNCSFKSKLLKSTSGKKIFDKTEPMEEGKKRFARFKFEM